MAKGLYKLGSPVKFWATLAANPQLAMAAVGGISSILGGRKANRRARAEQKAAREAMAKTRQSYLDLDTSNPYANLENTFEDLTINQKQAQFEAQQGQQQRADIMENLRGAAGGSGIAGLAQAMANQGVQQTARASASIGMQESRNQYAAAQGAARVQEKKAYGESLSRGWKRDTASTLYGMDMERMTAANTARTAARQQISGGIGSLAGAAIGLGAKSYVAGTGAKLAATSDISTSTGSVDNRPEWEKAGFDTEWQWNQHIYNTGQFSKD